MQKVHFEKTIAGYLLTTLIAVSLLSSCLTTTKTSETNESNTYESPSDKLKPKEQNLSGGELEDIALWKSNTKTLFTQNHLELSDENLTRVGTRFIFEPIPA